MRFLKLLHCADKTFVPRASVGGARRYAQGKHNGCEDSQLPARPSSKQLCLPWAAWPPPPIEDPQSKDGKGLLHQPLINKTNFLLALLMAIVFALGGMARTSNRGSSNKDTVCDCIGHHVAQSLGKILPLSKLFAGSGSKSG